MQKNYPNTVFNILQKGKDFLRKQGVSTAHLDAEILLAFVMNCPREQLYFLDTIVDVNFYQKLLHRRARREPISYITGRRDFWKYTFYISRYVLDPRPESELLVESVLEYANIFCIESIVDLGVGSGCLLFSILSDAPYTRGIGIDRSIGALKTARMNQRLLHLDNRCVLCAGDWSSVLKENCIDAVISNPPYIPTDIMHSLDVSLFEPYIALDGGVNGLRAYCSLIPDAWRVLKNYGWIFLEIGIEQKDDVKTLLEQVGFVVRAYRKDLNNIIRVLIAQKCLEEDKTS